MKRRTFFQALAIGGLAARAQTQQPAHKPPPISLQNYEPRSMLHAPETHIVRARFPVVDFHTHITEGDEMAGAEKLSVKAQPEEVLPYMDRHNIKMMVNLTGGYGRGLEEAVQLFKPYPKRFVTFTEPWWSKSHEPGYPKFQADQIEQAHAAGARGIKVLKTLGLYLRENVTTGALVKIDDRRFDPMWATAGLLRIPVAIHTSDPEAFFLPIDRRNERYEELQQYPEWSFYGKDFPSNRELQDARRRVMARHPRTQFVCLHVADAEDLPYVGECMDAHPNMHVELAARIGELGRQPRMSRKFIEKYQDRVMFGTDAGPRGGRPNRLVLDEKFYEPYFRFLETEDEYFDYSPDRTPPQGRWRIYGMGLPDSVLRKVYSQNAERLLGIAG